MNTYNPKIHHRRSIRLKDYDYSRAGSYFITICCQNRAYRFGKIENGKMILNEYGKIAYQEWIKLSERYPNFDLDTFQIMPNHMHGIITLLEPPVVWSTLAVDHTTGQNPTNSSPKSANSALKPTLSIPTNPTNPTIESNALQMNQNNSDDDFNDTDGATARVAPTVSKIFLTASKIQSSVSNIHSTASKIQSSASNIHSSASNIQSSASNRHLIASNIHSSTSNIHSSASNIQSSASNIHSTTPDIQSSEAPSISDIVGAYKSLVANGCLEIYKLKNEIMGKLWQRNYYEHIIRNQRAYNNITNYIINNPAKWTADKFHKK